MDDALLITLVIGASWVVFSLINIGIAAVVKKKGGGIHPFFMFCPVVNVLSGFVCWLVYLDEKKMGKKREPDYRSFRNCGGTVLDEREKKLRDERLKWQAKRKLPWWMGGVSPNSERKEVKR